MLKIILFALALIVLAFFVVVALQSSDFRIARSTTIAAPATNVSSVPRRGALDHRLRRFATTEGGSGRCL